MKFIATIFVEGKADLKFISDFVKTRFDYPLKEGKEILNVVSKDSLSNYSVGFKQSTSQGFTNLLIFDADKSYTETQVLLGKSKDRLSIEFKSFLLPNDKDPGNLETLLESIAGEIYKPILSCFNQFQDCLMNLNHKGIRIPDTKDKIYVYSSLLTTNEKAKEGNRDYLDQTIWNLSSPELDPLNEFLKNYFN